MAEKMVEAVEVDEDQEDEVAKEDGAGRTELTPGRQTLSTPTVPTLVDLEHP